MKLGLFGGTFDPIHVGHLIAARETHWQLGLERTLVLPAGQPPHKSAPALTPVHHRTRMVELALEDIPELQTSDLDLIEQTAYTVNTLTRARDRYGPDAALYLLVGEDSLAEFETWKNPERIVELCTLVVYGRPGATRPRIQWPHEWVEGPRVDVSSTDIRARLAEGRPVRFLVPDRVADYAIRERLYAPREEGKGTC